MGTNMGFTFMPMELPSLALEKAVRELAKLPGIGRRSALRLALHLVRQGKQQSIDLGLSIEQLAEVSRCRTCHGISDELLCSICSDSYRDQVTICVVESIRDVLALENSHIHRGTYHVLGGLISPMDGLGPNDLTVDDLVSKAENQGIKEIILALSATMEGDTTAFYLHKRLEHIDIKLTAIARGLPVGDSLEYADDITLSRSFQQRLPFEQTLRS